MRKNKIIVLIMLFFFTITFSTMIIFTKAINTGKEEKPFVVYIDPGHGGFDGGAVGGDGTKEKDLNLDISLLLANYLESVGIKVYLTRDGDYALYTDNGSKKSDIHNRVKKINESDCDLYLTIHLNAFPNQALYGAQTFYNPNNDNNKLIASSIQQSFVKVLKNTKRVEKAINDKYLIDHCTKTGCLVEAGFLSNLDELSLLKTNEYQDLVAFAIYIGIIDYIARCNYGN